MSVSSPGWIRTSDLHLVTVASTPGCSTSLSSRAGRSRTCLEPRIRRLPHRSATARISALYGTRTRLACSTGRSPHPLRHRAGECPAGVAPACPPRQGGAWAARPRTREQGRKESNPLRLFWRQAALPGARPCRSAEGAGLEPARACASAAFQAAAIVPVGSPFRVQLPRRGSKLRPSG